MKKTGSEREIAALANRCGITEREARSAIRNLLHGDGCKYERLIANKRRSQKSVSRCYNS